MQQDYFFNIQLSVFDVVSQQSKPGSEHLKNQKIQRDEIEFLYQQILIQKKRQIQELFDLVQELFDLVDKKDQKIREKNQDIRFLKERLFEAQDDPDNRSLEDLLNVSEEYE